MLSDLKSSSPDRVSSSKESEPQLSALRDQIFFFLDIDMLYKKKNNILTSSPALVEGA